MRITTRQRQKLQTNDPIQTAANSRLIDWAEAILRMEYMSCINYPSQTTIGRAIREVIQPPSGVPGSREPEVIMKKHIAITDRAVNQLPEPYRSVIAIEYLTTLKKHLKKHQWAKANQCHERKYRDKLDKARFFISMVEPLLARSEYDR